VISGEYFGWNLGLPAGGTHGMLLATLVVTVMYVAFVLSYAELACALPRAGGAFVYGTRGLGRFWGAVAGMAQAIEFVFAPPAIAMAIGAYVAQRFAEVDARVIATAAYVVFTALNLWGVRQAAVFEIVVTVLAVFELLVFMGAVAPSFQLAHFQQDALPNGWAGALGALPFAIWFYLGIEGVANVAEEARNPQRDVARGFGAAIATLVVLAIGVFLLSTGVAGWRAVVFAPGATEPSDAPLPLALAHVVARGSWLYDMLLAIGLLGLIASFHGILLAAGRATFELGRSGLLPPALGKIHARRRTPAAALVANSAVGIVAIFSGRTGDMITLAVFGAVVLYVLSMVALFALRRREPDLPRPFKAIGYPLVPATALGLAAACLAVLTWQTPVIAAVFAGLLATGVAWFVARGRLRDL
jgi:ethanolamine permease